MASQTVTLQPGESSGPIPVSPLVYLGIETDNPIRIETQRGCALVSRTSQESAFIILPPTDTLVITAGQEGADVVLTEADAAQAQAAAPVQQGVVTLGDGVAVVPSTVVSATTAALLTPQTPINGVVSMDNVIPGESFTIKSTDTEDASPVYYQLYETE